MKYILVALFLLLAPSADAYSPITITADEPYAEIVIPMDGEAQKRSYFGILDDFPHLYEFTLSESATIEVKTKQPEEDSPQPVNLILLSVNPDNRGVEEIVRMNTPVSDRELVYNSQLAISTYDSEWLEVELEPGRYRLEVSTPVNLGPYELDFGAEGVENGYFGSFSTVWQAQSHFGYGWPRYFMSTYVMYQIGIIILVGAIYYTWRRRRKSQATKREETVDAT